MARNGGLIRIRESLENLNRSERMAAAYILDHPEEVIHISIQRLAEETGVSEATIVRLARSLHYKGFRELKMAVAYDLNQEASSQPYEDIVMNGSIEDFIRSVSYKNIQAIQETLSILSKDEVEKAIDRLAKARKIAVFGIGASAVVAYDFKQKLTRMDRWCEGGFGFHEQATIAANLGVQDVVVGLSNSGRTEEMIRSLSIARENGATVITLTKFGNHPVSKLADIRLYAASLEGEKRSGAMSSRISMLNVIDILFIGLAGREFQQSVNKLEKTHEALRTTKLEGGNRLGE
ncbi:MAG TPA: MurR/RpiR family transcriptional regulator [Bacillales bacterium]|nr:MurR/RpiR family transcriptional regulator [Bacillales bacterium]